MVLDDNFMLFIDTLVSIAYAEIYSGGTVMKDISNPNANIAGKVIEVSEIFFDFEGTVVDFQWQLLPAVQECREALSKAGFSPEWYGTNPSYAHIYNHTLDLAAQGIGNDDAVSAMAIMDKIYDKYDADALTRWNLYPDTLEVLETLRGRGFRMGIISNIGDISLRSAMEKLGLSDRVDVIISRNGVEKVKPHPDGLIMAANLLKVDPARSIFIGDSRNDVGAARAAGMLACFIRGGEDSPEAMAKYPADLEIDSLSQLPASLDRITP